MLRAPASTKLTVTHQLGDRVAEVRVENPPADTLKLLAGQVGPFVGKVEHLERVRNQLRLRVHLTTDAVRIATRRLRKPDGWAIEFIPQKAPPFPQPAELIGRLPGLIPPPARPVLFPLEPNDTPCTGNPDARALEGIAPPTSEPELERRVGIIDDRHCRMWASSRLAAKALELGRGPEPFERWAFLFSISDAEWPIYPEAFAQTSLVVAEILSRTGYIPEAETILADRARYRRRHAPFRAMALANLFALRGERNEAETLYRQLVADGFDPWTLHRASLARALNALEGGDTLGTLKYIEQAAQLIGDNAELPGDLWLVGGEAALALGELRLAQQHFQRAARSSSDLSRSVALMRLADLELQAKRKVSALKGWSVAEAAGFPCASDHAHLRRVITLEPDRGEVERFLASSSRFSRCEAVRMEAKYALTTIFILRGEERRALGLAVDIVRNGISRWGPARAHRALVTHVASSAVARMRRHGDDPAVVNFFEAALLPYAHLLTPETRLGIARSYVAVNAAARGAEELVDLVTDEPKLSFREEILLTLGEAFLAAGDTYRTDLVLRHLAAKAADGKQKARRQRLAGRYELEMGRFDRALGHIEQARALYPPGDRKDELALESTRALLGLERPSDAATQLRVALAAEALLDSQLVAPTIEVLSECTRSCSAASLRSTTAAAVARLGQDFMTPRLVARLARRGALDAASGESETSDKLWSRLQALGVDGLSSRKAP